MERCSGGIEDGRFPNRRSLLHSAVIDRRYRRESCAFSGEGSAKRTPTPISRTGFPVRANASARRVRKSGKFGGSPARSAVVLVKSLNFSFTKIFVTVRVVSFCARSAI